MSISSRITQIENHLEDDYKALENLGASVEDRNIENIKEMAEQIYDNYPKTSYGEGTEVTLENCNKGKLDFDDGKVGFGQSSQESTQGYQLINVPIGRLDTPVASVTAVKEDDVITLNGSRNDGSTTNAKNFIYISNTLNLQNGDYRLTFFPISGTLNGGRLGVLFF